MDDFKDVNDVFGHLAGDRVLYMVGDILRRSVRTYDLVVRYGGEEFAIVLVDTNEAEAFEIAEHIRRAVEAHMFEEDTRSFHLSVSAGVATLGENTPKKMHRAVTLFEWADHALSRAKEVGKGRTVAANEADLKLAIAQQND